MLLAVTPTWDLAKHADSDNEKRRDVVRPLLQTGENVVVMLTQTM